MDASAANWLSDLLLQEMEDSNFFGQCHLNLLDDDEDLISHDIASALQQPLSSESYSCYSETVTNSSKDETSLERPTKQLKTNSCSSKSSTHTKHFMTKFSPYSPTSQSQILSFDNSNSSPANITLFDEFDSILNPEQNKGLSVSSPQNQNANYKSQTPKGSSKNQNFEAENPKDQGSDKSPTHTLDHIMAERKRREKLSQSLIALGALVPGLKKKDKASILGDAIKYVKELQEHLRLLEEESKNRVGNRVVESVTMFKKPHLSRDDGSLSRDDNSFDTGRGSDREALLHVEARVSEKDVLLRIHCQKQKGLLLKILVEIQNLHLFIVNSSVLPFGNSILDITIVAQMGNGFNLTINDLVKNLRVATLKCMS